MGLRGFVIVVLALAATYGAAVAIGASRWKAATEGLRARLDAARSPVRPQTVNFREIEGLPAPVQRYFRVVLDEGQPLIASVRVRHDGTFNMSETGEQWKPFTSEQWVTTRRPGFVWNGRVAVLPGVPARVHDAYVAGEGVLHVSLLGLASVAESRGGDRLAAGELMRYFAEATWYPTALLPSQGVSWEPLDDRSAVGTLADGDVRVTMRFTFDDRGLIETVEAAERGRTVGADIVPTPWRGRFWGYQDRGGMLVPTDGEVAWLLPSGEKPYWRGHTTHIEYGFAP